MLGRSALLAATNVVDYGNWLGNYNNVSLLLRNGTPQLVPLDESPAPKTITQFGNTSMTTTIVKYGTSAMAFDGSGPDDRFDVGIQNDPGFDLGTNDFTIEAWIYPKESASSPKLIVTYYALISGSTQGWGLRQSLLGLQLTIFPNSFSTGFFNIVSASNVLALDEWQHVAVTRSSDVFRLFVNGNQVATNTSTYNLSTYASNLRLHLGSTPPYALSYNGYIDDLRITKGVARYTSDFSSSLPAELPANAAGDPHYSDVSLLLRNETPLLIPLDESPTPKGITTFGNASITTTVVKYGTSAMVFDGSGDYFETPANADFDFGTGDFTIECWVNFNTLATDQTFVSYAAGTSGSVFSFALERLNTGSFRCFIYSGSTFYGADITPSPAVEAGTWYHVAGVRSGGQLRCYVNGVGGTAVNANVSVNAAAGRILVVGAFYTTLRFVNGYIDDLRITKGIARYTSNFTPPPAELPNF